MLPSQLSCLPLLPFLENHPHPAYLLPDDWLASTGSGRRGSAEGAVWLNEAAKLLQLSSGGWSEVKAVLRRAADDGTDAGTTSSDERQQQRTSSSHAADAASARTPTSDSSSDGSTPTVRMHSPVGQPPPPAELVLDGRFSTLLLSVSSTNYRVLQLVPVAPRNAAVGTEPVPARQSPSPPLSSLVPSPFSTSAFVAPPLDDVTRPPLESRPNSEGVILGDLTPTLSPSEQDRRRREKYKMAELVETFDWSKTALGPKKDWPQSLITIISVVMATATESCLMWGPELILIYNDAYADMILKKHPVLFGAPAAIGWAEIWDGMRDMAHSVVAEDVSIHKFDDLLFMQRDETGVPEETLFSWSWVGIKDESGKNGGVLNRAWETTAKVLAERRLLTLRELAQTTFACDSIPSFSESVISSLKRNPHDLPFSLLYVARDGAPTASAQSARSTTQSLKLVGSIGVPVGHTSAPSELVVTVAPPASVFGSVSGRLSGEGMPAPHEGDRPVFSREESLASEHSVASVGSGKGRTSNGGTGSSGGSAITVTGADGTSCPWPVELALTSGKPVLVSDCAELTVGFESRSWGDLTSSALVIPVENEESSNARCLVLIVGLNTRRPLDDEYDAWLKLIRLSLSSGLSGVASIEAQKMRAEELARLDRAKTTFFSNVSHELRTPLSLISGPVRDLLALYKTDSPEKRLLSITDRNVQRLTRLVDMLMDVSRVEAGRMQGTFFPRQLGQLTVDLASLFRSAIEKAGLEIVVECDIDDPRPVYVDPDLWEKICFNIIGNAFKYTLEGKIRIWVRYLETEVEFGVQDTGVGIPQEDVPRVVERFHRVSSTGRSFEGTGIGLSLTVELIKVHGGTLEVTSQTKEESGDGTHGSTFAVRLPLGSAHLPVDRIDESPAPVGFGFSRAVHGYVEEVQTWASDVTGGTPSSHADAASLSAIASESERSSSNDSSGKIDPSTLFWSRDDTILIVDDNADIRQYLTSTLSPFCQIIEARNGQEAYNLALSAHPNLIVSDVMMPVLDGFGLIRALKASQTEAAMIPVVIITARAGEDEKVGGLLDGADDYLPKPFSSKELIARCHLQMQMGKRRIDLERRFAARTLELQVRAVEAEAKRKEAEEQRRQQELLVDVTSHEIRTPVSAILQNAQLVGENLRFLCSELQTALKESAGFQPTTSLLSMIEEDVEACDAILMMAQSQERIANDVLSLARIQLSTLEIFPVPLDLMAETKRICSVFASECRLKRIHLNLIHGPSLQSLHSMGFKRIQADTGRLAQILINLLSNAIRFTSPAPVRKITVSIEARKDAPDDDTCLPPPPSPRSIPFTNPGDDEEVYIYGSVADSGPGLSQEELSRLFQRFRQGSAQTHVVFGGSGLGLYVCRKLLELMDGKIEVVSPGSSGSTFRFFFRASLVPAMPLVPLSPRAAMDDQSPSSQAGRARKALSPSLPSVGGMRVLIVEDNLINQKVLDRQLRKAGIVADIASDGAEALDKIDASIASADHYKVVLMDLEMPVLNGIGAITKIREREADGTYGGYRHTTYALTGNARQAQIDAALAAGMDDVILKPYKIDQLLGKLRDVLQLNR